MSNGINVTNSYCGCNGSKVIVANGQSEENPIFKKVDELPGVGDATRNHAYILPDNTVWVVNADGTDFSQLNGGSGAGGSYDDTELRGLIQQALDRNTMEDNRLVNIENKNATQDERLTALENNSSSGEAYDDTEIKERIQALEFRPDLDTVYTAGTGISISTDNVISATGGGNSYDDTELRGQVSAMSTLLDSKLTLSADNMSPTEAGLGDIYNVDFSNLDTKLENKSLTIAIPKEQTKKTTSKMFDEGQNHVYFTLERVTAETIRATVVLFKNTSNTFSFDVDITDLLSEFVADVHYIAPIYSSVFAGEAIIIFNENDNDYVEISPSGLSSEGNKITNWSLNLSDFTTNAKIQTYSIIFKNKLEE